MVLGNHLVPFVIVGSHSRHYGVQNSVSLWFQFLVLILTTIQILPMRIIFNRIQPQNDLGSEIRGFCPLRVFIQGGKFFIFFRNLHLKRTCLPISLAKLCTSRSRGTMEASWTF